VSPLQILIVCLRLVALVWVLYTLNHLYGLFAFLVNGPTPSISRSAVWFFALLQLATCGVLWFFPATIARGLLPSLRSEPKVALPAELVDWQTLGVIGIGLWALSRAIPDALYWATFYNVTLSAGYSALDLDAAQKAGIVSTVAELVIGFWLLFGAKGFAAFLFKVRTAGLAK
jgi:hypothetical protein